MVTAFRLARGQSPPHRDLSSSPIVDRVTRDEAGFQIGAAVVWPVSVLYIHYVLENNRHQARKTRHPVTTRRNPRHLALLPHWPVKGQTLFPGLHRAWPGSAATSRSGALHGLCRCKVAIVKPDASGHQPELPSRCRAGREGLPRSTGDTLTSLSNGRFDMTHNKELVKGDRVRPGKG